MARPLRIELAGGLYHVTSRGDRREAIFRNDQDRAHWLTLFGEVCSRFNWRCHAYCQMTNHYHILGETPDGNLSRGMRQLNGVFTQHSNRRHARVGHLFQGRFKGILVERDAYLLELSRYLVLNPVRSGKGDSGKGDGKGDRFILIPVIRGNLQSGCRDHQRSSIAGCQELAAS